MNSNTTELDYTSKTRVQMHVSDKKMFKFLSQNVKI